MKRNLFILMFLMVFLGACLSLSATVLISPTGDGGFESGSSFALNNWSVVNGTYNTYTVGNLPTVYNGANCAYSWNGTSWAGSANAAVNHIYRDVTFPSGESIIQLSFYYKVLAPDATYDYLKIWMVPTTTTPVAGTQLTATQIGATYDAATAWTLVTVTVPASYAGTTNRLVFSWKTDSYSPYAAMAIDNISLTSETPPPPISGIKTINPAGSGSDNYTTFTSAITALNNGGISGPVTFNVSAGATFNENCPAITMTGTSVNTITFQRSGTGANPRITPLGSSGAADAGMTIQGGDYFTFDGIDIDASAVTTVEFGYYIVNANGTNGAQYNTIRNCNITMNRNSSGTSNGIYQYIATTPTSAAGANSYNKYYNLNISNTFNGVYLYGSSAYRDLSCEIGTTSTALRNTLTNLGPLTSTFTPSRGIWTQYQEGVKIFNNDISNVAGDQASGIGIHYQYGYGTGNAVYNNKIQNISNKGSTTTTSVVWGIGASHATSGTNNIRIYNNMISNLYTSFAGTATVNRYVIGMFVGVSSASSSQSYDIDNNNISIGQGLTPTYSNACLELQNSSPVLNIRGNVFANYTNAQTGVAKHFGIVVTAAGIGATGTAIDYNDYYIANSQGTSGHVGRNQGTTTNYNTITDWKAFTTGTLDENSIESNPVFIDNNSDLHVASSSLNAVSGYANQAWVTTDFDYQVRADLTPSDIGADAFTPTIDTPVSFAAATVSNSVIGLTFTPAADNVVIVWNNTGTFTAPSGTPPANVGDAFGGGYLLYNGMTSPVQHTGLNQLTTYYYKAYSYNGSVYSPGLSANATTFGSPVVTSTAATSVTYKSAVAGGNVTSESGSTVTERGVCYGTGENPATTGSRIVVAGTTGSYTAYISGLAFGTLYHFRAYAINAYGTSYGADMTFTTGPDPTITSFPYNEGFDGTTFAPAGWDNYGILKTNGTRTTDAFWSRVTSGTYNSTAGAAKVAFNHAATVWGCLELPPINLPANHSLTFYWKDADSKIAGQDTTFVEISTDNGAHWTVLSQLAAASYQSSYTMADISLASYAGNGRLIRFRDGTNASYSAYGSFVDEVKIAEATNPPNIVTTPTPTNAATNVAINTSLSWVTGGGAPTGYKVFVGTESGNLSLIADVNLTTYTPETTFLFGKTYYWRVDAYNDYGSSEGTEWSFSTASGIATTPAPANAATAQDATNRLLNWADVAGATGYKVMVGTSVGGTDLVEMAEVTISQYTHTANWPWSSTIYWTVYTLNGSQEVQGTAWTFSTGADPTIYAPTVQDFSTFPPVNWTRWSGQLADPSVLSTTTSGWAADGYANNGTTGSAKVNIFGTSCKYWLITPPIDLGGAKAVRYNLEFDLALTDYGSSSSITTDVNGTTGTDDKFAVLISTDGSTWTPANILRLWDNAGSPYVYNNIATTGERVSLDLTAYTGSVKLAFYGESTTSNADNDLFVDNFAIVEAGVPPTAPTTSNPANEATEIANTATLSWSGSTNSPAGYKVYLSTDGTTFTQVADQTGSTYNHGSLWAYSTTFYWRVDAYNDYGTATGTVWHFTTAADPSITVIPHLNDFQSNINGWTILDSNGDSKLWTRTTDTAPNYSMKISWNTSMAMNDWLISPPVHLNGGTAYEIKYNYRVESTTYPENLALAVGTAPTAAAMTSVLADHPGIINVAYNVGRGTYTPSVSGTYYFGFHGYSDADMYNLFVDNFRITTSGTDVLTATATTSGGTASPDPSPIWNPVTNSSLDTSMSITGITGTPTITTMVQFAPPAAGIPNAGLSFTLNSSTGNLAGATVTFTHNLGFVPDQIAYRVVPGEFQVFTDPNDGSWTATTYTVTIPANKAAGDFEIVFPSQDNQTLPVELSSFAATLTADMFVKIAWMTQSETNHLGYNVLRSENGDLSTSVAINGGLITAGDELGSQTSYSYIDAEVDQDAVYYYWLQSIDLGGTSVFYGPLMVQVNGNPEEPGTPEIPIVTELLDAYPNPFNPSTTLRFAIKEAGNVRLDIFNARGQKVRSFENSYSVPGYYKVVWDGKDTDGAQVSSGIYMYRMTSGRYISTKKIVLTK